MQIARDMGFNTLRLYTDEEENETIGKPQTLLKEKNPPEVGKHRTQQPPNPLNPAGKRR